MAIVSLIALLAALALAALISLQPWAEDSVSPHLSVAPGLGVALGDSVVVSPGGQLAVAPARPAAGGNASFVASKAVGREGASESQLGIVPARAVTSPQPGGPSGGSPEAPASEPLPVAQPSPGPVTVPIAAPAPPASPEPVSVPPTRVTTGFGSHPPGPSSGGVGGVEGSAAEAVEVQEGDEHAFSFSFYIQSSVYLSPGFENLIMRFKGEASELPTFGLQLWDDGSGRRGLWAGGDAIGGERFLATVEEGVWHEAAIDFQASSEGDGFYLLLFDGQPIDARAWVSLIEPGSSNAQIEVGLFRDGERVVDPPDIFFGPTHLGDSLESVIP